MKTFIEISLQILTVIIAADFVAGFVHWFEDAYVREDTPLIGSSIGRPNIIHHHLPRYMTRFNWWQTSRMLFFTSLAVVIGAWCLGWLTWHVWLFAVISANANEVHKWSHRTRKENGRIISCLQDIHVLQTPHHHSIHHTDPKNCRYCPVTNLVNPILDRIRFWDALEWLFARTIHLHRRADTSVEGCGPIPDWIHELRREPGRGTKVQPKRIVGQAVESSTATPMQWAFSKTEPSRML